MLIVKYFYYAARWLHESFGSKMPEIIVLTVNSCISVLYFGVLVCSCLSV